MSGEPATAQTAPEVPTGLTAPLPPCVAHARFAGKEGQLPKQLHYFAIRGLGELPRLMLEASETNYDSVMYFFGVHHKNVGPFGQLPVYKGSELDFPLAQSSAICRHIARETGLAGSSAGDIARQDMLHELARDVVDKKSQVHNEGGIDEKFSALLKSAEDLFAKSEGAYFFGQKFGWGDVSMFNSLQTLEDVKPGFLGAWVQLNKFREAMASVPSIKAYLASPRRFPLTANELGKGHTGAGGYEYVSPLNPEVVSKLHEQ